MLITRYVGFLDPPYLTYLTDSSGNAINLSLVSASAISLVILNPNGTSRNALGSWSVVGATSGEIQYQFQPIDLVSPGTYKLYVSIQIPGEPSPRAFDPDTLIILPSPEGGINIQQSSTTHGAITYLVAASNANNSTKLVADFQCTGTADQTLINQAIALLPLTGGTILLSEGTFNLSGAITNPNGMYQGLRLIGSGWGTILALQANSNSYCLAFAQSGNGMVGAHIANLKIDANGANQSSGGGIDAYGAYRCLFDHVWIHAAYNEGIYLHYGPGGGFGFQNTVRACYIESGQISNGGTGRGIWMNNSDENIIYTCTFQDNGRVGANDPASVLDYSGLQNITNNTFVGGYFGIKTQNNHTKITNNTFDGVHNYNIRLNGDKNMVSGNVFYNPGAGASSANSISAIYCDNVRYCGIENNLFRNDITSSNATKNFVETDFGSTLNQIDHNKFIVESGSVASPIGFNGCTGNLINHNLGFVTANTGTATISSGSTSQTINHGLNIPPALANIAVTPSSNLGNTTQYWISNPTSSQFTINTNVAPGGSGCTFAWQIVAL